MEIANTPIVIAPTQRQCHAATAIFKMAQFGSPNLLRGCVRRCTLLRVAGLSHESPLHLTTTRALSVTQLGGIRRREMTIQHVVEVVIIAVVIYAAVRFFMKRG